MTKTIRIENADTSNHKVKVEVWEERTNGVKDDLVREIELNTPTQMISETIWKGKYLIIREYEEAEKI